MSYFIDVCYHGFTSKSNGVGLAEQSEGDKQSFPPGYLRGCDNGAGTYRYHAQDAAQIWYVDPSRGMTTYQKKEQQKRKEKNRRKK